jgi:hypothetical protein
MGNGGSGLTDASVIEAWGSLCVGEVRTRPLRGLAACWVRELSPVGSAAPGSKGAPQVSRKDPAGVGIVLEAAAQADRGSPASVTSALKTQDIRACPGRFPHAIGSVGTPSS